MISFSQAMKNTLTHSKHFDFKGRSCRSEFWWSTLGLYLIILGLSFILGFLSYLRVKTDSASIAGILFVLLSLLLLIFASISLYILYTGIIMSIRRLHDRNMRGWWYLMILIPYVGSFVLLVLFCLKGTTGPNRFGPDPLGRMQSVEPFQYQGTPNHQQAPQQYEAPNQPMGQPIQQGQPFSAGAPSKDKDL